MDKQSEQALQDAFKVILQQMDFLKKESSLNEVIVRLFDYTVRRSDEKITALEKQMAEMQAQLAALQNRAA